MILTEYFLNWKTLGRHLGNHQSETILDADGDASDWIEIYNAGSETVHLAGWRLTDNAERGELM